MVLEDRQHLQVREVGHVPRGAHRLERVVPGPRQAELLGGRGRLRLLPARLRPRLLVAVVGVDVGQPPLVLREPLRRVQPDDVGHRLGDAALQARVQPPVGAAPRAAVALRGLPGGRHGQVLALELVQVVGEPPRELRRLVDGPAGGDQRQLKLHPAVVVAQRLRGDAHVLRVGVRQHAAEELGEALGVLVRRVRPRVGLRRLGLHNGPDHVVRAPLAPELRGQRVAHDPVRELELGVEVVHVRRPGAGQGHPLQLRPRRLGLDQRQPLHQQLHAVPRHQAAHGVLAPHDAPQDLGVEGVGRLHLRHQLVRLLVRQRRRRRPRLDDPPGREAHRVLPREPRHHRLPLGLVREGRLRRPLRLGRVHHHDDDGLRRGVLGLHRGVLLLLGATRRRGRLGGLGGLGLVGCLGLGGLVGCLGLGGLVGCLGLGGLAALARALERAAELLVRRRLGGLGVVGGGGLQTIEGRQAIPGEAKQPSTIEARSIGAFARGSSDSPVRAGAFPGRCAIDARSCGGACLLGGDDLGAFAWHGRGFRWEVVAPFGLN